MDCMTYSDRQITNTEVFLHIVFGKISFSNIVYTSQTWGWG